MDNQIYDMIKREFDSMNDRLDAHFTEDKEAWKQVRINTEKINFVQRILAGIGGFLAILASFLGFHR